MTLVQLLYAFMLKETSSRKIIKANMIKLAEVHFKGDLQKKYNKTMSQDFTNFSPDTRKCVEVECCLLTGDCL
jgi:hypothetical protein